MTIKINQNSVKKAINWAAQLKFKRKTLLGLIIFNAIWSIAGAFADYAWLSSIPPYLIPLTAICSLYPPLLTIWYIALYRGKNPPNWFTLLIFIGIASYGIIAQIYFPMLMNWVGFNWHDFGSMFWVAAYGLQAFIIFDHLKPMSPLWLAIVIAFFISVDLTHYFYPTFVDFLRPGYPHWMKYTTAATAISIQIATIITALAIIKKRHQQVLQSINY